MSDGNFQGFTERKFAVNQMYRLLFCVTGSQTYKACSVEKVHVTLVHACVNVCKTVGVYVHVYTCSRWGRESGVC